MPPWPYSRPPRPRLDNPLPPSHTRVVPIRPQTNPTSMTATPSVAVRAIRTRRFYLAMALAFALTVFFGFSRSYFLKLHYGTPALSVLLHIHAVVFSAWILMFAAQTTLVAAHRTDLHR